MSKAAKYPGWQTMTAAERYNAKAHAMFEFAKAQGHTGFRSMTIAAKDVKVGDVLEAYGKVDTVANGSNRGDFAPDAKIVRMNP